MFNPIDFFDKNNPLFDHVFTDTEYVWKGLVNIKSFLKHNLFPNIQGTAQSGKLFINNVILDNGSVIQAGAFLQGDIQIGENSTIESGAYINGPVFIGNNTCIRQSAYIRGNVIVGDHCVIGHSTEIKNSVMFGSSKAGHFAYIGDSLLGSVNLGAGTKLANLKLNGSNISIRINEQILDTGLRKFGAILADGVETGCNSVTSPGTILGKGSVLYPNTTARGLYPPFTIIKLRQNIDQGEKSHG